MSLETLLPKLGFAELTEFVFCDQQDVIQERGQVTKRFELPIKFENDFIGRLFIESDKAILLDQKQLEMNLAPLLFKGKTINLEKNFEVFEWVWKAKEIAPELFDWIGIYYASSLVLDTESTDLLIGPYFGEWTDHVRIPLNRGLCGMAMREERIINVADVHSMPEHIACSLKTKSELIVPLYDKSGKMVAELDIDSHTANAFSPELEERVKKHCESFSQLF